MYINCSVKNSLEKAKYFYILYLKLFKKLHSLNKSMKSSLVVFCSIKTNFKNINTFVAYDAVPRHVLYSVHAHDAGPPHIVSFVSLHQYSDYLSKLCDSLWALCKWSVEPKNTVRFIWKYNIHIKSNIISPLLVKSITCRLAGNVLIWFLKVPIVVGLSNKVILANFTKMFDWRVL